MPAKKWIFTAGRKASLKKAQKIAANLKRQKIMNYNDPAYKVTSAWHKPALKGTKKAAMQENVKIKSILDKRKKLPISEDLRSTHDPRNVRLMYRMKANIENLY